MITLIFIVIYFVVVRKREQLTNIPNEVQSHVDSIYNLIKDYPDVTFNEYLDYLINIKNTNLHIIDSEVFSLFKALHKKGKFSKQDIIDEMKINEM
jgi:hypothetical protein